MADAVWAVFPDTTVVAPVPPVGQRKGKFSKLDFTIDTENHAITCPAGHTIQYKAKQQRANTKPHQVVQMDRERCKDCPLRAQCVDGKGPRTLTVRGDEAKVLAKRVEQ